MVNGQINPAIMEKLFSGPVTVDEINALEHGAETVKTLRETGVKIAEAGGYYILEKKAVEATPGDSATSPASAEPGPASAASPAPASSSPAEAPATDEDPEPDEIPDSLREAFYFTAVDIKVRPRKGALPKLELIPLDGKAGEAGLKLSGALTDGRALAVGIRLAQINDQGELAPLSTPAETGIAGAGTGAEGAKEPSPAQTPEETGEKPSDGENEPATAQTPAPRSPQGGPAPATTGKPREKTPEEIKRELAGQTAEGQLSPGLAAGMSGLLE